LSVGGAVSGTRAIRKLWHPLQGPFEQQPALQALSASGTTGLAAVKACVAGLRTVCTSVGCTSGISGCDATLA
jgi:hypothetical protein